MGLKRLPLVLIGHMIGVTPKGGPMKRPRLLILLVLTIATVAGCQTPYQVFDCEPGQNIWPFPGWSCKGGYSELEIAPGVYQVGFEAVGITTSKGQQYALLRSAEVALETGHTHFVVISSWGQTDVRQHSTSGGPQTHTTTTDDGETFTTFSSGSGGGTQTIHLPQAFLVIRVIDEASVENYTLTYDAIKVRDSIRQKYGLPPATASVASAPR
jgi:hypothetical protein